MVFILVMMLVIVETRYEGISSIMPAQQETYQVCSSTGAVQLWHSTAVLTEVMVPSDIFWYEESSWPVFASTAFLWQP